MLHASQGGHNVREMGGSVCHELGGWWGPIGESTVQDWQAAHANTELAQTPQQGQEKVY